MRRHPFFVFFIIPDAKENRQPFVSFVRFCYDGKNDTGGLFMRYSVCAALTAVLVAFVAYFLLGSFWPDVGAVVAVAVMGAFILEGGNPDDDPKEGEDIPEDNLGS